MTLKHSPAMGLAGASMRRRGFLLLPMLVAIGAGGAACSANSGSKSVATSPSAPAKTVTSVAAGSSQPFAPVIASSELVVGQNRFALGLLDTKTNTPLPDARVHLRFFTLVGNQGTLRSEADTTFIAPARDAGIATVIEHKHADGTIHEHVNVDATVGVYVAQVQFAQAGQWGAEASFTTTDGRAGKVTVPFTVLAQPITPVVGQPAPRTRNLTARDVSDLSQIDSAFEPVAALHQDTVADAIAAGRPTLVAFLTPGYCESRMCGPEYDIVKKLLPTYGDKVALIDIEVYKDPAKHIYADAVKEWGLQSEPYIFVIDRTGIIRAKFEGPTSLAELEAALQQVVS
ncbi:MAG: TlpA family protein disulfide reductase [Dehalococcoidia bacterium]